MGVFFENAGFYFFENGVCFLKIRVKMDVFFENAVSFLKCEFVENAGFFSEDGTLLLKIRVF